MTIKAQDLELYAGDTLVLNVTVTGNDGTAQNLASCTIEWGMYRQYTHTQALLKTTASGITITSAINGRFDIALSPADTVTMQPGLYNHEAEITDGSGNVSTVFEGRLNLIVSRV